MPSLPTFDSGVTNAEPQGGVTAGVWVYPAPPVRQIHNAPFKKPHMSARLFSRPRSPRTKPITNRTRSQTAPSTPLAEIPLTQYFELPGSFHFDAKADGYHSDHGTMATPPRDSDNDSKAIAEILRPHTSPQKFPHGVQATLPNSTAYLSPGLASHRAFEPTFRSRSVSPLLNMRHPPSYDSVTKAVGPDGKLSPLPTIQQHMRSSSDTSNSHFSVPSMPMPISRIESSNTIPLLDYHQGPPMPTARPSRPPRQSDLEEIIALRLAYESHTSSLKQTHESEMAAYRAYISALESKLKGTTSQHTVLKGGYDHRKYAFRTVDSNAGVPQVNNSEKGLGETVTGSDLISVMSDPMWLQVQSPQRTLAEKKAKIQDMESEHAMKSRLVEMQDATALQTRVSELEKVAEHQKSMIADARADAERYNSLLHHEIRRQSRTTIEQSLTTQDKDSHASAVTQEMISRLSRPFNVSEGNGKTGSLLGQLDPGEKANMLEHELEHCVKELVLLK
jgi:hypothetical protein